MSPQTQKALFILTPNNGAFEVRERDVPQPGPGELLVKVHAASLNPVDWFIHRLSPKNPPFPQVFPVITGFDSAGTVEEIGEGVAGFVKGDRVMHAATFGNDYSSFQQYTLAPADFVSKLPQSVTFEEAASLPLCLATAVEGLYGDRETPEAPHYVAPWIEDGRDKYHGQPIVIFGGASTVGQLAIQLAKLSGFSPIITTASLKNEPQCKSAGATHVIDRSSATLVAEITAILNGAELKLVYDAVTQPETVAAAFEVLAPGGVLARHPRPMEMPNSKDKYEHTIWGSLSAPKAKHLGLSLTPKLGEMLQKGEIKPMVIEVLPDGLDGIPDGLERLFSRAVSAKKLIARPIDS